MLSEPLSLENKLAFQQCRPRLATLSGLRVILGTLPTLKA